MQVEKPKMERESEETSGRAGPTTAGSGSARREQQESKETRGSDGETTAPGSTRREQQEDKETRGSDGETTAPGSDGRKREHAARERKLASTIFAFNPVSAIFYRTVECNNMKICSYNS